MKELFIRAISGVIYISLLVGALYLQEASVILFAIFGVLSLIEFSKLIKLKSIIQYIVFIVLYGGFWYLCIYRNSLKGSDEANQILLVLTIFVNLILIKDLFAEKKIPLFESKRYITTTLYLSSGFVFMLLIANYKNEFTPLLLLGSLILVWVNDSFAYLVGKNFRIPQNFTQRLSNMSSISLGTLKYQYFS